MTFVAQILLAITFIGAGIWKLATPTAKLAAKMPWMGEVSPGFLRMTAIVDLAGGIGVIVPTPLVGFAAIGCGFLQLFAIVFHVRRGEASATPFNVVLVALAAFVASRTLVG